VRELFPGATADMAATRPATRPGTRLDLDFGAFPDGFVYMGDRIYIRRWSCRSHRGPDGVTLQVLDRETFALKQSVPIVDCDNNYQDTVGQIREVDDLLLVWVNYRWESETRTDLVVLRRSDLSELGRVKVGLHGFDEARITPTALLLCVCGGQKLCKEIDRQSWQVTTISGEPAAQRCAKETSPFEEAFFRNAKFEATKQPGYPTTTVIFRRRESGDEIGRLVLHSAAAPMATDDADVIVVHDGSAQGTHIVVVGLAPLRARLAMVLPHRAHGAALSTVYRNLVIMGYGRDLLVYDWRRSVVVAYFKEFIEGAARASGAGLDRDQIVRLMVDRDRLVALTFTGMNSRLVPLEPLRRDLAGAPDFFEPSPALLAEKP
jgi:hypothetical protein